LCPPHSEALRQLVDWRPHDVLSAADGAGDTVSHYAARAGDASALRALLERDNERGTLLRALNAAGDSPLSLTVCRLAAAAAAAEAA
jgi:ankyrin repeat protein